ncbi:Gfo/Idh/MocA family protein [Melittangium boletus]|uniref:Oxidoreductase n=1 Tax=Melittangium boletus DSM 14713 TaxID=1294270 RepID=A0A250IDL7_9BACT|nr:Gfo/Idh/MocA family oxidoreductase [Melittangium boletus]ATB29241.1 oxidoreductase [Melittangium boletus DSM 14713]
MTLRVGIISANWGTYAHLPAWRAVPGIEVVAVCTSRKETAEAAAERCDIPRAFWDARAMAADPDIDIIDCGTRASIREGMVLACLENGKHVYNAIPHAVGLEGARVLNEAWARSGRVGVVDAFSEWVPAHQMMKEMIEDGALGQPFGGTCVFNMSLYNILDPRFPYNWFAEKGHGVSAVRNLGSHALHMLAAMFGEVEELVAHDGQLLPEWRSADGETVLKVETNDFASMLLRFKSGLVIQCQCSWNATLGSGWLLDVFGSKGRLVAQAPSFPTSRDTTLHAGRLGETGLGRVEIPERLLRTPEVGLDSEAAIQPAHPMSLSMNAMARAIEGKGQARPDFAQAWRVERQQEAIQRSMRERRWVRIDEIT